VYLQLINSHTSDRKRNVLPKNAEYQGAPWSSKVVEFRKTIFHAWKVMESSEGHGKSWKMMIMSCNFSNCTEQFCKCDTNYEP